MIISSTTAAELLLAMLAAHGFTAAAPAAQSDGFVALRAEMARRGVEPREIVVAFEPSTAVARFAIATTAGAATASDKANRIFEALMQLVRRGAIRPDRDNRPKARAPKTAAALLDAALEPAARDRDAGCYELAALFVAVARAAGVSAVGVSRERTADSGQIGHVMAGMRRPGDGGLELYDVQNGTRRSAGPLRVLDDLELAAHHYSHRAVAGHLSGEYRRALDDVDRALRLAPENAAFLSNRATVLTALGERELAVAEVVAAIERAPDVPVFRYTHGRLLLGAGDVVGARASLAAALALYPGYGLARRDLGWSRLLSGDPVGAERDLLGAVRAAPAVPGAPLYLALYYLSQGRRDDALKTAGDALAVEPGSPELGALRALAAGERPAARLTPEVARLAAVLATVPGARAHP